MTPLLEISNLRISVNDKPILNGISLNVHQGQIVAIMGPNGSGKSTLAKTIMGSPEVKVDQGTILFEGENITELDVTDRAKLGIFLAFQYPQEIPGVNMRYFLKSAYEARFGKKIDQLEFKSLLSDALKKLDLDSSFVQRNLNYGFSGGEKKKSEILQLLLLKPKLAILDETDSGLDIDSLKSVAQSVTLLKQSNPEMACLIITHYERILEYLIPDKVYIMKNGYISAEGDINLVNQILEHGYACFS